MSFNLAPLKRLSLNDLIQTAVETKSIISIDESVLNKFQSNYETNNKNTSKYVIEQKVNFDLKNDINFLPLDIIRASLIYRLNGIVNGTSLLTKNLILILLELVNSNILPLFSSLEEANLQLVNFLAGEGYAYKLDNSDNIKNLNESNIITAQEALSKILATLNLESFTLSTTEAEVLLGFDFLPFAIGAYATVEAESLISVIDAAAAFACEAIGCKIDPFDTLLMDTARQQRGQILSASNIKILVDGSKRVTAITPNKKDKNANLYTNFHIAPQIIGPSQEVIQSASKSLDIELNSAEMIALDGNFKYDATQSIIQINNLSNSIQSLINASSKRVSVIRKNFNVLLQEESSFPLEEVKEVNKIQYGGDISNILSNLETLKFYIAYELAISLRVFEEIEKKANNKAAEKEEKEDKEEKNVEKNKKQLDESNLTPEQKARAEAKRKAKAEKAAAKAAAKAERRGGVVLGAGSTALRTSLLSLLNGTVSDLNIAIATITSQFYSQFAPLISETISQLHIGGKRRPKIARGARDFTPQQMRIREEAFNAIRSVFKRHGGEEIDTPVFELREVLTGKYGEDSKLIYDLADQGGELLSLRYDLTVPFARFLAMNSVGNIKRFHIAKVYRRDNPQVARGRYREFYQCDFDIAGTHALMTADAEVISICCEILSSLPVGEFLVKFNHRVILDAVFAICGVPPEKFRTICSAVDKLDKNTWEEVREEMVVEKKLDPAVADRIGEFVLNKGEPKTLLKELVESKKFESHPGALQALSDLEVLFNYLEAMNVLKYISFDLSLARGLDYYTGVIYEAVLVQSEEGKAQVHVGSIAAGGRYDNLVGMFSPNQTPCVGISIGIERVFTIMEKKAQISNLLNKPTVEVYIASIGDNLIPYRMKVASNLWENLISAEYSSHENPKLKRQMDEVLARGIPFMVIFGEDEISKGIVKVKNMKKHEEVEMKLEEVVDYLVKEGVVRVSTPQTDDSFISALKRVEL